MIRTVKEDSDEDGNANLSSSDFSGSDDDSQQCFNCENDD